MIGYFALPDPGAALRAVARARAPAAACAHAPACELRLCVVVLAGCGRCGGSRVRVGTTPAATSAGGPSRSRSSSPTRAARPATLKLDAGPHDVQGHQRRHRPRQRARGARRRAHPRREGEPRRRPVRLVHADLQPGQYTLQLPRRDDRGDRRRSPSAARRSPAPTDPRLRPRSPATSATSTTQAKRAASSACEPFVAAVKAGDVEQAKAQFAAARVPYETIEPVAESFGNLDPDIDARVNDVKKGQTVDRLPPHRAGAVGEEHDQGHGPDRRQAARRRARRSRPRRETLTYQPDELANGANGLLDEVATSKITGEEDRYSHTDL